jgi:anti-sigma regulatory factor (Ser/Thr protein kinase)
LLVAGWHWRRRRQRAAAVLAEARRQAQWAERLAAERTALMAELSHEIRNPLNGVLGMARLLLEQPLAGAARRYLGLLQDAGRQLARLLDDMLDWSRMQARSEALATAPVALSEALAGSLAHHAAQAQARGLGFRCEIAPQIGVLADALRLRQIAENLVGNAVKFTVRGEVAISAEVLDQGVRLRVRDTGPGLNQAQIERLFQPFERVGDERAAPGTGLGLAISRNLAERMGGRLWVESEPGVGSCFVLDLAAAELPAPVPAASAAAGVVADAALAGLELLVVDDDATARECMQALLASCRCPRALRSRRAVGAGLAAVAVFRRRIDRLGSARNERRGTGPSAAHAVPGDAADCRHRTGHARRPRARHRGRVCRACGQAGGSGDAIVSDRDVLFAR